MPSSPSCLAANILPSSFVLLHIIIWCTCFFTFWNCHSYILQHFNGNILLSGFTGFSLYRNIHMAYYVSIKAYNCTIQDRSSPLFNGRRRRRKRRRRWRNRCFSNFLHVIVAVYFSTFESVIVSRNTCRPCHVSKMAYSWRVWEFWAVTFVKT